MSAPEKRSPAPRRQLADVDQDLVLRQFVDSVIDYAIFTLDVDGYVTSWNPGAERLKGYVADEIIGRHFSTFYTDVDLEAGKPAHELAVAVVEGRFEDEGWRVRQDGSLFWANVVITAVRSPDGRLLGFGKVTRDLTERKRNEDALRESEERFRLLVARVADYAIFLLDPDGTISSWNLGAERLKGYTADEIIGCHFSIFYTDEDRRDGVPAHGLATALAEGRWEQEGWRVRQDGSRFWADVVITSLRGADGRHWGFAKVTRDLTERKRNEDALQDVLAREREASARLRDLDRMRSELTAIIAHDLRAPVGVIQNMLAVLRSERDDLDEGEELALLDRLSDRTDRLGSLVDDVFDFARIETDHLPVVIGPIDLGSIATKVVADAIAASPGREVTLHVHEGARAVGDERRCWQVLSNLVFNAVKFSPDDTPVEVTIEPGDGEVVVLVTDRGPGIPVDEQPVVFQRFVRLSQTDDTPGSGIGLYIARSLVEAQGGRIWIDSEVGRGSTFGFALPGTSSIP